MQDSCPLCNLCESESPIMFLSPPKVARDSAVPFFGACYWAGVGDISLWSVPGEVRVRWYERGTDSRIISAAGCGERAFLFAGVATYGCRRSYGWSIISFALLRATLI